MGEVHHYYMQKLFPWKWSHERLISNKR